MNDQPAWRTEETLRYYEREFAFYSQSENNLARLLAGFCLFVIQFLREQNGK